MVKGFYVARTSLFLTDLFLEYATIDRADQLLICVIGGYAL